MEMDLKNYNNYIKNIYYMLSYVYADLIQYDYKNIDVEEFKNIGDILSIILFKSVSKQIKRGLLKSYSKNKIETTTVRGKINIKKSISLKSNNKNELCCEFHILSINNYLNSIIKTAMYFLILSKNVSKQNKNKLKKLILLFSEVDLLDYDKIKWDKIKWDKSNKSYKSMINISYLVLNELLMTDENGKYEMSMFLSEKQIYTIYEKFVFSYYKKHHQNLCPNASKIKWNLDSKNNRLLPEMKSDITLTARDKVLIIDTKFYSNIMQTIKLYDSKTIHSNNLYQIFTYVKNKDVKKNGSVSGMLLYAKTDDKVNLDEKYIMSGNEIMVKTIDLTTEFKSIAKTLDKIAEDLIDL